MGARFDSRTGLWGPGIKPQIKPGDWHLVVNDRDEKGKLYDSSGALVATFPVLAKGVYGPGTHVNGGDTPPGLYLLGQLYRTQPNEPQAIWRSYGALCWDMEEQEGQEADRHRAGVCLHGGGTGARPHHLAPRQELIPTLGCLRMTNEDLEREILPRTHEWQDGRWIKRPTRFWVSVYQDRD